MGTARKSLGDAARLALLLSDLTSIQASLDYQAVAEQSGSETAAKLKAAIVALGNVLRELVDDEVEALGAEKIAIGDLQKRAEIVARAAAMPLVEKLGEIDSRLRVIEGQPMPASPFRPSSPTPAGDLDKALSAISPEDAVHLMFKLAQLAPRTAAPAGG